MKKEFYEVPELEIVRFTIKNVLLASGNPDEGEVDGTIDPAPPVLPDLPQ